jgi:hypothetical protein
VSNDVDVLPVVLGLPDLPVDPVQVAPGVVKVEQEPKVEVVAKVGVEGQEAKTGTHKHLQ